MGGTSLSLDTNNDVGLSLHVMSIPHSLHMLASDCHNDDALPLQVLSITHSLHMLASDCHTQLQHMLHCQCMIPAYQPSHDGLVMSRGGNALPTYFVDVARAR